MHYGINGRYKQKGRPLYTSQRGYPGRKGFEPVNDGLADRIGSLVFHLGQNSQTAFALIHRNNSTLMARPNDGVAFPVTNPRFG